MSPYRKDGLYFTRVRTEGGRSRVVSMGTRDAVTAKAIQALVNRLVARRQWPALTAIVAGVTTLPKVYDADERGELAAFVAQLTDRDLEPYVAQWHASLASRGVVTADKMLRQVRSLIPKGQRFPASQLAKARVSEWRDGLPSSNSTRNRYRSALFAFAAWLVERDYLSANPLHDVKPLRRNAVPFRYLRPEQYRRLVQTGSTARHRAIFALLYGTGMEVSALLRVTRTDVDPERRTVVAHGTKKESRDRECGVDAWAWPIVWEWTRPIIGSALLFPYSGREDTAAQTIYRVHSRLLRVLGYPHMPLHNSRHSFAVAARRAGRADAWIARQLGHSDTTMVQRTYGNFTPDAVADRDAFATSGATSPRVIGES